MIHCRVFKTGEVSQNQSDRNVCWPCHGCLSTTRTCGSVANYHKGLMSPFLNEAPCGGRNCLGWKPLVVVTQKIKQQKTGKSTKNISSTFLTFTVLSKKKFFLWRIRNRFKIKRNEKFFPTFSNQKKTYFPKSLFKPTSDSNLSAFRIHCLKLNCAATSAPIDGTPDAVLSQLRHSKLKTPFIFVYGSVSGVSFGLKSFGLHL